MTIKDRNDPLGREIIMNDHVTPYAKQMYLEALRFQLGGTFLTSTNLKYERSEDLEKSGFVTTQGTKFGPSGGKSERFLLTMISAERKLLKFALDVKLDGSGYSWTPIS
jgi:hypothetical protein